LGGAELEAVAEDKLDERLADEVTWDEVELAEYVERMDDELTEEVETMYEELAEEVEAKEDELGTLYDQVVGGEYFETVVDGVM